MGDAIIGEKQMKTKTEAASRRWGGGKFLGDEPRIEIWLINDNYRLIEYKIK